jgi:putative flippase GtrA
MLSALSRRMDVELLRYVLVGGLVAGLYTLTTTLLILLTDLPLSVAVAGGYLVAVCVHFALHRGYVWSARGSYALTYRQQVARYLGLVVVQYVIATTSVLVLVRTAGFSDLAAFVLTTAVMTPCTFLLMRARLFHARADDAPGAGVA